MIFSPSEIRHKIIFSIRIAVKEDALAGTVVIKLDLSDADSEIPPNMAFFITSGNPLVQFSIRNTGEVYVSKAIDRETQDFYELNVIATDGKFVTSTKLAINILDVNGIEYFRKL